MIQPFPILYSFIIPNGTAFVKISLKELAKPSVMCYNVQENKKGRFLCFV